MEEQVLTPPGAPDSDVTTPTRSRRKPAYRPTEPRGPAIAAAERPALNSKALAGALERREEQRQARSGRDLRRNYLLTAEIGLVFALLLVIGAFHVNVQFEEEFENTMVEQEVVQMEEIVTTKQELTPPPPPKPMAPVVVSDNVEIEDVELHLDAALDIGEAVDALPPPPPEPAAPVEEDEDEVYDEIFMVVEEMPELIGGIESIQERIRYPEMARMAGISGRVFVQFIVDEKGRVVDPIVVRGIGGGCDEEAIRAVSQAKFKPGKQRGKPVKVRYVLPVLFRLK